MDDVTTIERKPNVAIDKAVLFSMRNLPLLQQGTTYDPLATAENLWVNIKVYASGGENALHSHGGEDHAFIVLQGKATFTFGDGRTSVVGQYEEERALQVRGRPGRESRDAARRRRGPHATGLERFDAVRHAQGCRAEDIVRGRGGQGRRCRQEWRNREGAHLCQGQVLRAGLMAPKAQSLVSRF